MRPRVRRFSTSGTPSSRAPSSVSSFQQNSQPDAVRSAVRVAASRASGRRPQVRKPAAYHAMPSKRAVGSVAQHEHESLLSRSTRLHQPALGKPSSSADRRSQHPIKQHRGGPSALRPPSGDLHDGYRRSHRVVERRRSAARSRSEDERWHVRRRARDSIGRRDANGTRCPQLHYRAAVARLATSPRPGESGFKFLKELRTLPHISEATCRRRR
jgi:hypothetical protein